MASSNLMTTGTASFSGLLANGVTYNVPVFQRDYSWREDNWSDLWDDVVALIDGDNQHYMGAVVLQKEAEKSFIVIDGQQRLTTLSLLVLAVIKKIQALIDAGVETDDNTERIAELRRTFLGQKDPASLLYSSKLLLNENNNAFYQGNILQLKTPRNERTLSDSERLLWQGLMFFYRKVEERFSRDGGQQLASFLSKYVGDRTMFIKIEVENELSAYTLFETLNYRGVDLTVTDLLKNYLFSLISPSDLAIAKEQWRSIVAGIGLDTFPTFLRHFWISRNALVRQEKLFAVIRSAVRSNEDVFALLDDLELYSEMYIALQDPYNSMWHGERERIKRIRELDLFQVKQPLPLLMVAKVKLPNQEFDKVLKIVAVISFRYNVIGRRQANVMEETYNKAAMKVFSGETTTAQGVFGDIHKLYVSDEEFRADFSMLQIYPRGKTKKLTRYILFELENNMMQGGNRDFDLYPATIEHILPEKPTDEWDSFPKALRDAGVDRLANYTLLEDRLNKECGTLSFDQKKPIYAKSQYEMAKMITYNEWNPNTLDTRQGDLAKRATAVWRVPYTA